MKDEIVLYQPNDQLSIELKLENETVWLTQQQMAMLFNTTRNNITLHIGNIFKEGELDKDSVCKESLLTAADGKVYKTNFYNLDVIISVGYRVKSIVGTKFRQWANRVIKGLFIKHRRKGAIQINITAQMCAKKSVISRKVIKIQKNGSFICKVHFFCVIL